GEGPGRARVAQERRKAIRHCEESDDRDRGGRAIVGPVDKLTAEDAERAGVDRSERTGGRAMSIRGFVMMTLAVLALASSASAECAWVLWSGRGDKVPNPGRIVMSAFPKADDCHPALAPILHVLKQKPRTQGSV